MRIAILDDYQGIAMKSADWSSIPGHPEIKVSVHLVLSPKTRGIVGESELAVMKPSSYLINTSRGPLIEEAALIKALEGRKIAGCAVDVFEHEPLALTHPFRRLPNVLATPHIGFGSQSLYETFYRDSVTNITNWILNQPGRDR